MEASNKLIAEFMGYKHPEFEDMYRLPHGDEYASNLKYDYDWNWLMPVVIKCFEVEEQTNDDLNFKLNDALLETNIDSLYKVVVEFIKNLKN
tara:strand:+ start:1281 stop:1556 length:276 start_codon:yes stop_codon:yes gene_type:complete